MPRTIRSPLLAVVLIIVLAGTALATAGSGLTPTFLSRGTLSERVHFNTGAVKLQTKKAVDAVMQTITFGVPSSSGWHAHPGVVIVTVTSGSLARYDEHCSRTVYTAGTSSSGFVESGNHAGLVRNEGATEAVVHVTYLVPAGTSNANLRIDKANPGCPGLN